MPYALYSTSTGQIFNVLYQQPTNTAQLSAIASQGLAFAQVPLGIGPSNSMIDLNTNQPIPTGPSMTFYFKYEFDPATGFIGHVGNGNIPVGDPQLTQANMILSTSPLDYLTGGMVLTLDSKGKPIKDVDGNYVATVPDPVISPPDPITLIISGLVNAGYIDAAHVPENIKSTMNASLATVGAKSID